MGPPLLVAPSSISITPGANSGWATAPTVVYSDANAFVLEGDSDLINTGATASTTTTYMRIDDNEGNAGTQQVREFYAQNNNRWVMTDYLMPVTPNGILPQWQVIGGTAGATPNTVNYAVRLEAWVLRM